MNLIPDEELQQKGLINLTPMVDFLFLIVAVFAILAVTKTSLFDSEIHLARIKESPASPSETRAVNVVITEQGQYKLLGEFAEYIVTDPNAISQELLRQEEQGLLPNT